MAGKRSVLFVDDEAKILKGIRRMLFQLQGEWQMYFAEGGKEALELLQNHEVSIIVSDMRMPGMNGFELLKAVKENYPEIIRVMLTGQPDKELYCEVMSISHYFLWKPSKYEDFELLFKGISELETILQNDSLIRLIGGISSLPSLPDLYVRLTSLVDSEESSSSEIAEVINEDMSMTAQVLKLVNSAFFGITREVKTLHEAVSYLGIDMLRNLVLVQQLFSGFSKDEVNRFHLDSLWNHSLCTATIAREICKTLCESETVCDKAYLGGLLHDIGKLVMIRHMPDRYCYLLELLDGHQGSQEQRERQAFGSDHAAIGGYLVTLWGLPRTITEAVCRHHDLPPADLARISPVREAIFHANLICGGNYSQSEEYREIGSKWKSIIKR